MITTLTDTDSKLAACWQLHGDTHHALTALADAVGATQPALSIALADHAGRIERLLRGQGAPGWPEVETGKGKKAKK